MFDTRRHFARGVVYLSPIPVAPPEDVVEVTADQPPFTFIHKGMDETARTEIKQIQLMVEKLPAIVRKRHSALYFEVTCLL